MIFTTLHFLYSTKLPSRSVHAIQWFILDFTMNWCPISFHSLKSIAPGSVSLNGEILLSGMSPLAGHDGRGQTALVPRAKPLTKLGNTVMVSE